MHEKSPDTTEDYVFRYNSLDHPAELNIDNYRKEVKMLEDYTPYVAEFIKPLHESRSMCDGYPKNFELSITGSSPTLHAQTQITQHHARQDQKPVLLLLKNKRSTSKSK